jgi:hypothetical protein
VKYFFIKTRDVLYTAIFNKGRPPKSSLVEAALWTMLNKKLGEKNSILIKRNYEKYKEVSPNLKSFSASIKYIRKKIKKERTDW